MADTKISPEFLAECKRQFAGANWEVYTVDANDTAAIAVRTVLMLAGERALLADIMPKAQGAWTAEEIAHAKKEREAMRDALMPLLKAGAPVNFRRGFLVDQKIAPAMTEKAKSSAKLA